MKVKVENAGKNTVQLEIEVDAERFEKGLQRSFVKNAKRFSIPGFRKGKAPRNIVEKYYGEQVLYEDAINDVCPEAYDRAVEENGIHPVDRPEIDIKQIGKGQALIFTAKVTVKPEVKLGQYKGIEVKKADAAVTDEDVEKEIAKVLEKNSRIITVEDRPVASGDIVTFDFEGFIDGKPFESGKREGYSLTIGSGAFIPGFEEQLVGAVLGEEKEINVIFPDDYENSELAGKSALFKVKVEEIKVKEVPPLDDEFAKDVSEFDTLEEYRADIKKKLVEEAGRRARRQDEDNVVEKVAGNAEVDIPPVMIEKYVERHMRDYEYRLKYQGLSLEKYLEIMGIEMGIFREQLKEKAEKEIKAQLVIEKVGEVEGIVPAEEEINEEIRKIADSYRQTEEEFRQHLEPADIEYIRGTLIARKTVDFLLEHAKLA